MVTDPSLTMLFTVRLWGTLEYWDIHNECIRRVVRVCALVNIADKYWMHGDRSANDGVGSWCDGISRHRERRVPIALVGLIRYIEPVPNQRALGNQRH